MNTLWVARNKNGLLRCAIFEPTKLACNNSWVWNGTKAQVMNLPVDWFREVTWETGAKQVKIEILQDITE